MKLLIFGSRKHPLEVSELDEFLKNRGYYGKITEIVSGGARGPDTVAEEWANANNIKCSVFYPDWKELGHGAGVIRNVKMAEYCDEGLAFWDGKSPGTRFTINKLKELGKNVLVIKGDRL